MTKIEARAFHALMWLKKNAPPGIAAVSLPVHTSIHSIINARVTMDETAAVRQKRRNKEVKLSNAMALLGTMRANCARAGTGDAGVRTRLRGFRDLQDPVRELLFWRIYRRMVRTGIKTGTLKS